MNNEPAVGQGRAGENEIAINALNSIKRQVQNKLDILASLDIGFHQKYDIGRVDGKESAFHDALDLIDECIERLMGISE